MSPESRWRLMDAEDCCRRSESVRRLRRKRVKPAAADGVFRPAGALLQESAKPTNESSPALQRWELGRERTGVREADDWKIGVIAAFSAVRCADYDSNAGCPSAKARGYYQSVRFADATNRLSQQSPLQLEFFAVPD